VPVGSCPTGGKHTPIGWIFALPNDHQGASAANGQGGWRFCGGCQGLFFDGYASKGVCPGSNGGGIRLQPVMDGTAFYPFTATDPVGETLSLEVVGGAFSQNDQVYVLANMSDPRYSQQIRPGDPAYGCYLASSGSPDAPQPFVTQYQFSPRIGTCAHADTGTLISHEPRGLMFVLATDPAHGEWRMCQQCAGMFHQGGDNGHCFGAGGGPHVPIGDLFTLPVGTTDDEQDQSAWRRCARCQTAYWDGDFGNKGECPAGGQHQPTDPMLTLPHRGFREDGALRQPPTDSLIRRWRFCVKCAGMFWEGVFRGANGVCPAGGAHDPWGFDFLLAYNLPGTNQRQADWRLCHKCNGLFWTNAAGACPSGGAHTVGQPDPYGPTADFNFSLTHDVPADQTHQDNWRFCGKCAGMFWAGTAGVCPKDRAPHQAGAGPSAPGFDFVLPHDPGADPAHQENWRFCRHCYALVYAGQLDWFSGAAPYVVNTNEHPGLPPSPSGRGLVLIGLGYNPPAGLRLAWLPLPEQGPPRLQDTLYWHGSGAWSPHADDTVNLVDLTTYTSVSLTWLKDPGVWVLLYSLASSDTQAKRLLPVNARFAATPWDLATAPAVTIFDPTTVTYLNSASWPYGANLIERYTRWHPDTSELDLAYLLSLASPYEIQLMRTTVRMS
jgi:hypothetical protein